MRINMKEKVKRILLFKKATRDNDFYLMYWIWQDEFNNLKLSTKMRLEFDRTSVVNILALLKDKKLSHPSGIMRARRKIQEKYPDLRGELWSLRHKDQEVVKADLG